jgi:hypothetical protein
MGRKMEEHDSQELRKTNQGLNRWMVSFLTSTPPKKDPEQMQKELKEAQDRLRAKTEAVLRRRPTAQRGQTMGGVR